MAQWSCWRSFIARGQTGWDWMEGRAVADELPAVSWSGKSGVSGSIVSSPPSTTEDGGTDSVIPDGRADVGAMMDGTGAAWTVGSVVTVDGTSVGCDGVDEKKAVILFRTLFCFFKSRSLMLRFLLHALELMCRCLKFSIPPFPTLIFVLQRGQSTCPSVLMIYSSGCGSSQNGISIVRF